MDDIATHFAPELWDELPDYFDHLPEPVRLHLWADGQASPAEGEAFRLLRALSGRFEQLSLHLYPRRVNYPYYPVIGAFGLQADGPLDYGVRIIGLPAGYQMTSLVAAVQSVAFRGTTSEARTRIMLHRLAADVTIEIISAADDEAGAQVAQLAFNLAVASPHVRSYLVVSDAFPEALVRHSVRELPHVVVNGRLHLEGPRAEAAWVDQILGPYLGV
ncbi:MAG: hypothetical protein ACRDHL_02390 [Candidatus Promineifilaceae bacterium]